MTKESSTKKRLPHAIMVARGKIRHHSKIEHPVAFVWDMCDQMKGASRKDVVNACLDAGVAYYTARTQYQLWKAAGQAGVKNPPKVLKY